MAAIDTEGGVIKEILATPFVKEIIRESINSAKASSSAQMVRDLMWQDMEFFFSLIATIPLVINSVIAVLSELGYQIDEKIEPGLLKDYMAEVIGEIDTDNALKGLKSYRSIVKKLMEQDEIVEMIMSMVRDSLASTAGHSAGMVCDLINKTQERHPDFFNRVVESFDGAVDRRSTGKALMAIINPVMDRVSLTRILWRYITGRIAWKFRRNKRFQELRY
jgi:hypothetical protein